MWAYRSIAVARSRWATALTLLTLLAPARGQSETRTTGTAKERAEGPLQIRLGPSVTLVPSGQYRPRLLFHGERDLAGGSNHNAVSHRARLGLEASLTSLLALKVELQDVRTWGEEVSTVGDYSADGFDVHQVWGELRLGRTRRLSLRAGRQELKLDNERLIGAVGWSDQGRSFDGAVLGHDCPNLDARLFYFATGEQDALVEQTAADGSQQVVRGARKDSLLGGAWVRLERFAWLRPSVVAIFDRIGVDDQNRVTFGTFIDSAPLSGLRYQAEAYLQLGEAAPRAAGAERQKLRAFLVAARLSYTAPVAASPAVELWGEYLSGDDDPDDDTTRAFDTLFATNHKFYGYMDFFLAVPAQTGGRGLIDIGARVKVTPLAALSAWIDVHHFRLAREDDASGGNLGSEIDLLVDLVINRFLALQAVLAVFVPGDAMAALRGSDEAEPYGYLQASLHF